MTQATNTTPGTVLLTGDLAGTATSPALAPTGVTPGAHFPYKLWIDSKGRILKASDTAAGTITDMLVHASDVQTGIVKVATGNWKGLITSTAGTIDAPYGSSTMYGQIKPDQVTTVIDGSGTIDVVFADATTSQKGILKVTDANGLSITDATISITVTGQPDASAVQKGTAQIGTNINVASGVISVPTSTNVVKGVASVTNGNGLLLSAGNLTFSPSLMATAVSPGFVQVGSGIQVSGGTISVQDATTGLKGLVQVGANINVVSGVISVPTSTSTVFGALAVTSANGLDLTTGTLTYTPPPIADATTSARGLVQVGANINVASGVISIPDATTTTQGKLNVTQAAGLAISAGTVSYDPSQFLTTTGQKAFVKSGAGLVDTVGVFSIPLATTVTRGRIKTSTGFANTSGTISSVLATSSTFGVMRPGSTLNIAAGIIDIPSNYVKKNVANTYAKAQIAGMNVRNAMSGAQDFDPGTYGDMQLWNLTGDVTLSNSSSPVIAAGGLYTIIVKQDATGGRAITFDTRYKFNTVTPPALSTAPNAYDKIQLLCLSTTEFLVLFTPDWT